MENRAIIQVYANEHHMGRQQEVIMKKAKVDWKSLTPRKKAEYVWDYYKIHILVGVLVLGLGVHFIVKLATHRDPLMNIIMLDCENPTFASSEVFAEFLTDNGHEIYEQAVNCNTSIDFWEEGQEDSTLFSSALYENGQLKQAYHAFIWSNEYDVVMGQGDVFQETVDGGAFIDLSDYLSADTLEIYEDYLIYTDEDGAEESYPCAIVLGEENGWLQEHGLYKTCSVGLLNNAPNPEISMDFLRYLLAENLAPLTERNP